MQFSSVQFSHSVMSEYLRPHGLQYARLPLSITNTQSLLRLMSIKLVMPSNHLILCHPILLLPAILHSIRVFFNGLSLLWGGQSIGVSAIVFAMNIQGWFLLGLTGLISLQSMGLSKVFSSTTVQKRQFFSSAIIMVQLSHLYTTTGKTTA